MKLYQYIAKTIGRITNGVHWLLSGFVSEKFLASWKPIHLCWWFDEHGFETPRYFIGTHVNAPTVSTGSASSITTTSFTMGGSIDNTGGSNPTVRGFCYVSGAGGTPTISDSVVNESGSYGTGSYSLGLSGLSAGTTYSVRAYATNSAGTGYGSTVEVATEAIPTETVTHTVDCVVYENEPPTVVLNSPADLATEISTTPTLEFTGTDPEGDDIRYNIQIDTVNTFDSVAQDTYYFDASISTLDPDGAWVDEANATDGSTGTRAEADGISNTGGSNTVNELILRGTNAPSSGGTIGTVEFRVYLSSGTNEATFTTNTLTAELWTQGGVSSGEKLGEVSQTSLTEAWSSLVELTAPTGGWTWEKIQNLETILFTNTDNAIGQAKVFRSEVVVTVSGDLLDKVSGTDAGFSGSPDNTDPFTSGQQVSYTVQSADELAAGTYYWRVRGLDPDGSDTFGAWSETREFTVEAGGGAETSTHTVDVLVRESNTSTHSLDVLARSQATAIHTADTYARVEATSTHTVDALVKETQTASHSFDVLVRETPTTTHTIDTSVVGRETDTHTVDVFSYKKETASHTIDISTRNELAIETSVDTLVYATNEGTHTADVYVRDGGEVFHTVDSLIKETSTITHTIDVVVFQNDPPTVVLNTADATIFTTGTPTLEFTGTDPDSNDVCYEIEITSVEP